MLTEKNSTDFEAFITSFEPSYENLKISENPYAREFAYDMEKRLPNKLTDEGSAEKLKKVRLPSMKGLPVVTSMCLVTTTPDGKAVIMLPERQYITKASYIHEDIWDTWEKAKKTTPEDSKSTLFEKLNKTVSRENMLHGYIIESTEGRQLVISDDRGQEIEQVADVLRQCREQYEIPILVNMAKDSIVEIVNARSAVDQLIEDNIKALSDLITPHSLERYKRYAQMKYIEGNPKFKEMNQMSQWMDEIETIANKKRMSEKNLTKNS